MNLTRIINRLYFNRRYKAIQRYSSNAESVQKKILQKLLSKAAATEWGRMHGYASIKTYEQFAGNVPVNLYSDLEPYIQRMRMGERNILWPGRVRRFAFTSGTTGISKFIPVTDEGLKCLHIAGGQDSIACYLHNNPQSRMLSTGAKSLVIGSNYFPDMSTNCSITGYISAILIDHVPEFIRLFRVPDRKTALLENFIEKRDRIADAANKWNVASISGPTSSMFNILKRTMEVNGVDRIDKLWPDLEVIFHGGMSFAPYKEQFRNIIARNDMHYVETYNASEGFFGVQTDLEDSALTLMVDYMVFYEFCPVENLDSDGRPVNVNTIVPLWKVEKDREYVLLISTACGLWRYIIGDTVRFTGIKPYKFVITGRTQMILDVAAERLELSTAERCLADACTATGAVVREFTVAPACSDSGSEYFHQWVIEFDKRPDSIDEFTLILDNAIKSNSYYYKLSRERDNIQQLQIVEARTGLFEEWLAGKAKLGGQNKMIHLSNTRQIADELLAMNALYVSVASF